MPKQKVICPNCVHCFSVDDQNRAKIRKRHSYSYRRLKQSSIKAYFDTIPETVVRPYHDIFSHFSNLPSELKIYILSFIDVEDHHIAKNVCNEWRNILEYLYWKDRADLFLPDHKWLQMQEREQKKILDDELDEYMYCMPLIRYMKLLTI